MLMPSRVSFNGQRLLPNLWRLLVFVSTIIRLEILLIHHESRTGFGNQLVIKEEGMTSLNQIAKIIDQESIPSSIGIDLRETRQRLMANLPVERISLDQLINPSRLQIELFNQVPIALGERYKNQYIERGQIDNQGRWVNSDNLNARKGYNLEIRIKGWQSRYRNKIAEILNHRDDFHHMLKEIHIDGDGVFWLILTNMGPICLGPPDDYFSLRIETLKQLSSKLPIAFKGRRSEFIDLSCLEEPEISFLDQDIYKS
uniref:Cell division protein FtsQ n=1 Tax=Paulinella micropora TaxID=1928728 RepID=A0A385HZH4_9EUKA|nr:hypothetical protein PMNZ_096 [Paulinella micropora]AXY63056.1 hypothetical protein PMNZ_096 [Paulinella micropora]